MKTENVHPVSKHGNAMWGSLDSLLADQIMEEEELMTRRKKNKILLGVI